MPDASDSSGGDGQRTASWQNSIALIGACAAATAAILAWQGVTSGPVVITVGLVAAAAAVIATIYEAVRSFHRGRISWMTLVLVLSASTAAVIMGLREGSDRAPNGSVRISGGCAPFLIYGQNRWAPLGAKILDAPQRDARQIGTVGPNKIVYADGWVRTESGIPLDSPPWNSDIWFHLTHDQGWVDFGGVRALPTTPDPTNGLSRDGGQPVPALKQCQAVLR